MTRLFCLADEDVTNQEVWFSYFSNDSLKDQWKSFIVLFATRGLAVVWILFFLLRRLVIDFEKIWFKLFLLFVVIVEGIPNILTRHLMEDFFKYLCIHISKRDYFRPMGKSVYTCGELVVSLTRGNWACNIDVNIIRSSVRK